ncbi:Extra-large guanine nucleotide-binding protein 2 [Rhizophlyctis rosea]|nr:Extra-large guanine nucleotide-binding protein 2 [Rhizophlyctis rosea]
MLFPSTVAIFFALYAIFEVIIGLATAAPVVRALRTESFVTYGRPERIARAAPTSSPTLADDSTSITITINNRALTSADLDALKWLGYTPQSTDSTSYWYDPVSGAFGFSQKPLLGFMQPFLPLGFAPVDASTSGTTNIFVNGRELPQEELTILNGVGLYPEVGSRWWLLYTGAYGSVGSDQVLGNLWASAGSTLNGGNGGGGGGGGGSSWNSGVTDTYGGKDGQGFGYVGGDGWSVSYGG